MNTSFTPSWNFLCCSLQWCFQSIHGYRVPKTTTQDLLILKAVKISGYEKKVNKLRNDLPLFDQPIHGHTFLYLIGISSDKHSFLEIEVAYICSPVMGDFRKIWRFGSFSLDTRMKICFNLRWCRLQSSLLNKLRKWRLLLCRDPFLLDNIRLSMITGPIILRKVKTPCILCISIVFKI